MTLYDLSVVGDPQGQPRPRAFARHGKARVYDPGTAEYWKSQIAAAFPPVVITYTAGAVTVDLAFVFQRPQSHYRQYRKTGLGLVPSAPRTHVSRPDVDNLAKAVLDCLTTIGVWRDDTQVNSLVVSKRYADPTERSGCRIRIAIH